MRIVLEKNEVVDKTGRVVAVVVKSIDIDSADALSQISKNAIEQLRAQKGDVFIDDVKAFVKQNIATVTEQERNQNLIAHGFTAEEAAKIINELRKAGRV